MVSIPPEQEGYAEDFISSGQVEALEELSAESAAPAAEFAASAAAVQAASPQARQERQALSAAGGLRSFSQRTRPWK
jgi:hypothetical protein